MKVNINCLQLTQSGKYLEVLFTMEDDRLGLDFAVFDVNLVAAQNDGNIFAHSDQVSVPIGNVLVCHARGHVEHDDGALP